MNFFSKINIYIYITIVRIGIVKSFKERFVYFIVKKIASLNNDGPNVDEMLQNANQELKEKNLMSG